MSEVARAAGFVLAGGRSRRMGRDKALLEFASQTLVEAIAAQVRDAAGSVTLLGDPARYGHLGLAVVPDIIPGQGPLSGLHAALETSREDYVLLVACDMPNVEAGFLRTLLRTAFQNEAKCVVARTSHGLEPLCAVYHRSTRADVARALGEGRLRIRELVAELGGIGVDADPRMVQNVNTEDDWNLHLTEKERAG
ncbi:MAG TPA: molybdenum cofactor guanylyltransferase [Bryobacteraceae bacterium]|jgi:molybdopterin-guanine dinucleotide biosynthesis protein A